MVEKKYKLIANPAAGRGKARAAVLEVVERFKARGVPFDLELTTAPKQAAAIAPPQRVTLPAVINGRIIPADRRQGAGGGRRQPNQYAPGDADRYVFEARKGQDLVIAVSARDVMPYLADAVPGWFQATVALVDAAGKEVAYDDDFRFHPDPVLHYRIPADGDYTVEIKDALYRGREDFVYRLSIGELPFVTSIFPLGGRAGAATTVEFTGWNLAASNLTRSINFPAAGVHQLAITQGIFCDHHDHCGHCGIGALLWARKGTRASCRGRNAHCPCQTSRAAPESNPGAGGESGEGPGSAAEAAFMQRAYPNDTISVENMNAARSAFVSVKGRPLPQGRGQPGAWVSVGPSQALYPATIFRSSFSYVPTAYYAGGRTTDLAIASKCEPGNCLLYATPAGGGIWRTKNALDGQPNWEYLGGPLGINAAGSVTIDPNDPSGKTIYVGTGEANVAVPKVEIKRGQAKVAVPTVSADSASQSA